jgi:L-lactate dehydrogenase complex protein LldF
MTDSALDARIGTALADAPLRAAVWKATAHTLAARDATLSEVPEWEALRSRANAVKREAIENLAECLERFEERCLASGIEVRWARDAAEARDAVIDIVREERGGPVVKSKSMATEEIYLNPALEAAGIEVLETDLGEYIVQLKGERPSHIIAPALHLSRGSIGKLFADKLGIDYTDDPGTLTMHARRVLREKFLAARVGVSGANFLVAETGNVVVVENEGNALLTTTLPRVHVIVAGIEKVIPRFEDLAVFLRILPRSGTGQRFTSYVSVHGGPADGRNDGPERMVVILIDNGRTDLLANPRLRETLYCIRCGACQNICPVYRRIGGHAYGSVYGGPIGAAIAPTLDGDPAAALPFASSLCGACAEICPVKIDIHHVLLAQRALAVGRGRAGALERIAFRAWRWAMTSPGRYRAATSAFRFGARFERSAGHRVRVPRWGKTRDLPEPARESFHEWWERTGGQEE